MGKLKFGKEFRILLLLALTGIFFFVELTVGYFTNSMSLVADSFHMLSDEIALLVAYVSVRISSKDWKRNTYGWARAEVLGALTNAVFLVAICFTISVEAFERFMEARRIRNPQLLLIIGSIGLLINIIGLLLFLDYSGFKARPKSTAQPQNINTPAAQSSNTDDDSIVNVKTVGSLLSSEEDVFLLDATKMIHRHKHSHSDPGQMNMRGVFLHVLSDALGSVIVIISALIYWLTNWTFKYYVDPALSIILVLLILNSAWPLLRDSALILLQTVPAHMRADDIKGRLLSSVDGVLGVHEFHVWQLAGDRIIASAHVRVRNLLDYMKTAEEIKEFFHNEGIHSTTIQPEFIGCSSFLSALDEETDNCILVCPPTPSNSCVQYTCCGPFQVETQDESSND